MLARIKELLAEAFGERLHGVVLYGSQARGAAHGDSDIDVLVLLAEPVNLGKDLETIVHALYPLQLALERPIHALPVSFTAFQAGTHGLYRNASREGVFL